MTKAHTSLQNIKKELIELQKDLNPIITVEIKKLWEQVMVSTERKQRLTLLKQGSQKIIQDFENHLKKRSERITGHLKELLTELRTSTAQKKKVKAKTASSKKNTARSRIKKTTGTRTKKS